MNSVLEELWYGNIVPNENMGLSKEIKKNMTAVAEWHDKLYSTLEDEQKTLFEKFNDVSSELSDANERQIFFYAFRLGAKLALEIME